MSKVLEVLRRVRWRRAGSVLAAIVLAYAADPEFGKELFVVTVAHGLVSFLLHGSG